ncbi:MAG TPA: RNA polymerase sigma factor [Ignavibacteriaceae bacterium]|jgi:RNA polymerase sigma-70 factor (ECF subfamily)|nr:MAG: RNA polymerase subunit sigma-70 [Ignavibacteriales bacterium UTCHB2]HQF42319.1 RNA polymerase sigma factor [Ignavibacteriaceae bacterium]HQI41710.1 RNA polymerase sigma factor [Ignavibacteriaceae bacterium]
MHNIDDDFKLIKSFINGDESAFNQLIYKYQERIYWHARRMTGNHLDADEIVQEVLLVIYNKIKSFEFKSSFYTWVYAITNTRSINYLKKRSVKRFFSLEETENKLDDNNIILNLEQKQQLQLIENALQKLPVKQREVFIMRNYDEMSYEEISEITGRAVGTLKANYFHAINKIKELVGNEI